MELSSPDRGINSTLFFHLQQKMSDFAPVPADVLAANETGIKLFGRWESADVEVKDISLTDYIQVCFFWLFSVVKSRGRKKERRSRGVNEIVVSADEFSFFVIRFETPSSSPTLLDDTPPSNSERPKCLSLSVSLTGKRQLDKFFG